MELLKNTLNSITSADKKAKEAAKLKWDSLVKPLGSLGTLEELGIKIAGMTGSVDNKMEKRAVVVMSSDNGVFEEGVASSPQEFTAILTESMAKGITGVATLAKFANAEIVTVDIGLNSDFTHENVIDKKIAYGTKNFTKEPAMTYEEAVKAIEIGIEIGDQLFNDGYDILGTGELGIGNTTTSAAVLSALSDLDVDILMLSNTCKISSPRSVIYSMSSLPILLTGFTVFMGFFLFFLSIFLIMALIIFLSVSVKIEFT